MSSIYERRKAVKLPQLGKMKSETRKTERWRRVMIIMVERSIAVKFSHISKRKRKGIRFCDIKYGNG